jgi:multidrug efflux pump subunit AcrA (membrane-fusion protein)
LVAPFDGVVSDVNANLGKQISVFGADKVADLIDTSELEVRFSLSNAQYGRLLDSDAPVVGQPVRVSWQVGNEMLNYSGTIERVGAEIASTTGGVDAYAVIDTGGKQVDLRPGAFVSVSMLDKQFADVLEAPESALYGEDIVYVVENGRLSERRIEVHGYAGNRILFTAAAATPIENGDLIVTTQIREGGAGARVDVR